MGNCCVGSGGAKVRKPNPFSAEEQNKRGGLKVLFTHNLEGLPIRGGLSVTDKYTLGEELGRGEFGITYLCTDNETQEEFACKSISKKKLRTAIDIEDVRREVTIMHHLASNPNIVSLRDVFEADDAVHIVMELCQGGELFDRIVARGRYNECAAAEIIKTIAEIIQSCHSHGVMHRDLKPENFLFANMKENSPLKAIDFGFSVYFKPGERFSEIVGSPYYMAPEVYKRDYGPEVDIWSAGVILYILFCGVPPFWADTEQGIARAILAGVIDFKRDPFPMVSESAKSMVQQMLEPNPNLRLTAQQVLDHPWIQNAKNSLDVPLGDAVRVRLKQFSTMNKFKKKALRVIVEHLSGEEVKKIKDLFKMMDTNNNGLIDFDGLKSGIQKLGCLQLAESEIQQLMEAADIDGNGMLDYGEFAALTFHLQRFDSDEHLQKAFSSFDLDSDGYISIEELKQVITDDSSPDSTDLVERIMQEVDIDKDGQISYKEFGHMMRSGMDWRNVSRHYSRQRLKNIRKTLKKDGSLQA